MRDNALGQVVSLDLVLLDELADLGRKAVVAADHALQKAFMREQVESLVFGVALPRRVDQRKALGAASLEKSPLQGDQKLLRHSVAAVAGGREHITVTQDRHRVFHRNDLLQD